MDADDLRTVWPPRSPLRAIRWVWRLTLDIIDEYRRDGVGDLAASVTFWTLLSIPATVLALVSAVSAVEPLVGTSIADDLRREVTAWIAETFANSDTLQDAADDLFESGNVGVITAATAIAVFSLSRGFAGLIRALDEAYGVENGRAWWHTRLVAIGMGVGTIVVVTSSATALALLPRLPADALTRALAAPAAFLALVLWAATLFHVAPYRRTPWRYDLPGALLTAVGWVLASQGFAFYVEATDNANRVQSLVGAVLLGLTLMWWLSTVLLVGAELNDVVASRAGVGAEPVRWSEHRHRLGAALGIHRSETEEGSGEADGDARPEDAGAVGAPDDAGGDEGAQSAGGHHQASATAPSTPSRETGP